MSKVRVFEGFWTINDVINNKNCLFVFGDNDARKGKGGQAIIRGLSNTIGIRTKHYPNYLLSSYYSDDSVVENCQKIKEDIDNIILLSKDYQYVILPKDGFGTGLANLPKHAPQTYNYLVNEVYRLYNTILLEQ
ncbi:Hypothetical protein ORPV_71 [Orpheovirus IHUMI-LCC2]|uniref:DUF7831 domain-containing protein n=1 Tax=Orpheovirus IHUMI-LCC2 TaxID=2023057 RepID=A0A2I2L352_9VIRU|nr:Hypothetical protein ORPV_71 [Orpheovirus IHUMI-LCC2]SNW61975.1 Hypothetical protein ORPV_71 [Orpheovirus IHUMI-LCC2]